MIYKLKWVLVVCASILFACKLQKPNPRIAPSVPKEISNENNNIKYKSSYTQLFKLEHTKLEVSFSWLLKQLYGKAFITLYPYRFSSDSVQLNARGMNINNVYLLIDTNKIPLQFFYNDSLISIKLNKIYARNESFTLYIDYTANPEKIKNKGSAAITDDKGLYFINADGADTTKPIQLWTQGETESNSVWFPTIEGPNQKMTQEIYITIDSSYVTLSNGLNIWSKNNNDGTRTDYWKQSLPHAPYLTMMAAGNFSVTKDKWRNIEVSYYTEPEFLPYARLIFGNTPEMLEFFSNKLGIDYPWEKYSQIVVRDFVSGAMENTTATVHREALQQTKRELLDNNYEHYISHELFHQWFGNLVTCESWANVTLNEGFANYGEYLWCEYKYGREAADEQNRKEQAGYISSSAQYDEDVIRYYYKDKEDMYDVISYQKGGRILHMLRKYVGDDLFFSALKKYLTNNRYGSAEIHDLRLAFESETGEDLNWFFNQWFLNKGKPKLAINYSWNDTAKVCKIILEQKQDLKNNPQYKLPVDVDFYFNDTITRVRITIDSLMQTFLFPLKQKPLLVNFDAQKMLLCTKTNNLPDSMLLYQYYHAPLYMDRYEAIKRFADKNTKTEKQNQLFADVFNDKSNGLRKMAIAEIKDLNQATKNKVKDVLIKMATSDSVSQIKAASLQALNDNYKDDFSLIYSAALNDSSYTVLNTALKLLLQTKPDEGLAFAAQFENETNTEIINSVANYYVVNNVKEKNEWFMNTLGKTDGFARLNYIDYYSKYFKKLDAGVITNAMEKLFTLNNPTTSKFVKYSIKEAFAEVVLEINERITKLKLQSPNSIEIDDLEKTKSRINAMNNLLNAVEQN